MCGQKKFFNLPQKYKSAKILQTILIKIEKINNENTKKNRKTSFVRLFGLNG